MVGNNGTASELGVYDVKITPLSLSSRKNVTMKW